MEAYLNNSNYVIGDLLFFNTAFNPADKDPLVFYIQDHIWLTFTRTVGVEALIEVGTYTVWTDVSMTPLNLY